MKGPRVCPRKSPTGCQHLFTRTRPRPGDADSVPWARRGRGRRRKGPRGQAGPGTRGPFRRGRVGQGEGPRGRRGGGPGLVLGRARASRPAGPGGAPRANVVGRARRPASARRPRAPCPWVVPPPGPPGASERLFSSPARPRRNGNSACHLTAAAASTRCAYPVGTRSRGSPCRRRLTR